MTPLYVCGPYAGTDLDEIERNVCRAMALGELALIRGYAPIVPHAASWLGLFGSGHDDGGPSPQRERAVRCGSALARFVGAARGQLWGILRDDLSTSAGCQAEIEAWSAGYRDALHSTRIPAGALVLRTWAQWQDELDAVGIDVQVSL